MVRSRKRKRGDRRARRCEWCGERFKPASRSHQRFHSRRCKELAHVKRRRQGLQLRLF